MQQPPPTKACTLARTPSLSCSRHADNVCRMLNDCPKSSQASEKKNRWVSGNYMFFRMHRISDIYFVGGFGTVQWVDVADYVAATPDQIVRSQPHQTLQVIILRQSLMRPRGLVKSLQLLCHLCSLPSLLRAAYRLLSCILPQEALHTFLSAIPAGCRWGCTACSEELDEYLEIIPFVCKQDL